MKSCSKKYKLQQRQRQQNQKLKKSEKKITLSIAKTIYKQYQQRKLQKTTQNPMINMCKASSCQIGCEDTFKFITDQFSPKQFDRQIYDYSNDKNIGDQTQIKYQNIKLKQISQFSYYQLRNGISHPSKQKNFTNIQREQLLKNTQGNTNQQMNIDHQKNINFIYTTNNNKIAQIHLPSNSSVKGTHRLMSKPCLTHKKTTDNSQNSLSILDESSLQNKSSSYLDIRYITPIKINYQQSKTNSQLDRLKMIYTHENGSILGSNTQRSNLEHQSLKTDQSFIDLLDIHTVNEQTN